MSKMSSKKFEEEEAVSEALPEVETLEPVVDEKREYVDLDINNPAHGNLTDEERQDLRETH